MHYSKYLKGIPEPVVATPPEPTQAVVETTVIPTTDGANVSVIGSTTFTCQEMKPEDIVLGQAAETPALEQRRPWDAQSQTGLSGVQIPASTPQLASHPIVDKLKQVLTISDPIRSAKISKTLDIILNGFQGNAEPEMVLDGEEAMEVFMELNRFQEEYFSDIPMVKSPSQMFVWNIPRKVYDDMKKAKEQNLPDYCNPLLPFYLMLTEDPGIATVYFLKRLGDIRYDDNPTMFNKYVQDYLAFLPDDEPAEDDDSDDSLSQYADDND